jgi:hypothetical protein
MSGISIDEAKQTILSEFEKYIFLSRWKMTSF